MRPELRKSTETVRVGPQRIDVSLTEEPQLAGDLPSPRGDHLRQFDTELHHHDARELPEQQRQIAVDAAWLALEVGDSVVIAELGPLRRAIERRAKAAERVDEPP